MWYPRSPRPSFPWPTPAPATLALAVLLAASAVSPATGQEPAGAGELPRAEVIHILSPPGRKLSGRTRIETLTLDKEVTRVIFYVDGREAATARIPPFDAKLELDSPPREQTISVTALDSRGRELGGDEIVVNSTNPRFTVRITDLEPTGDGKVAVRAQVSLPPKAVLARLELYYNDELRKIGRDQPFEAEIEVPAPTASDFVRVVALLADGRSLEDVELLEAQPGLSEEVDVNLVQLQTFVALKNGAPVTDLEIDDFEIRERGKPQDVARMYVADGVRLNLGLVLDSSGSMERIWDLTLESARRFLTETVGERDRAFVVNFDDELRLVQPLTGDLAALFASVETIEPAGGTALYDSILYSLLQFENEPGRRALVVLTDGYDVDSTSNPKRSVEFARLLGVPVYVLSLAQPAARPSGGVNMVQTTSIHDLRLLTDPSGGRLIRIGSMAAITRAFSHVNRELRNQYVLMYYSDDPPDADELDAVEVRVPGRKGAQVRTVWALDQVN